MIELVAGMDIGGTNTIIGLVDREGEILEQINIKTTDYPIVEDFVEAVSETLSGLCKNNYRLMGLGIGAPNANYNKGTIELAPNLQWKGIVPLAGMIEEKLGIKVALTNDANAAALGEMMFGGARGMKDFIVLTLGTGLGSGIVVNGDVVYGHSGFAGEYGHVIMKPDGRTCGCGRKGCLETYVSATGIVRTVESLLAESDEKSALRGLPSSELTSLTVARAASDKDPLALKAFDFTADMLALAIVNAVVVTSPEAIFLFGGLSNAGDLLLKPLISYVDKYMQPVFRGTVKILLSGVKENNAAVLGSAALAWNETQK